MKKIVLIMIILLIISTVFYIVYNNQTKKSALLEQPIAKILYSKPIGPTQEPPYQLESKLISGEG